jgi:hypothetical protein
LTLTVPRMPLLAAGTPDSWGHQPARRPLAAAAAAAYDDMLAPAVVFKATGTAGGDMPGSVRAAATADGGNVVLPAARWPIRLSVASAAAAGGDMLLVANTSPAASVPAGTSGCC